MDKLHAVRARHLKSVLAEVDRLSPEARDAVRKAVDPSVLEAIDDATGVAWLPLEMDLAVTNAIYATIGKTRAGTLWKDLSLHSFRTPIFRVLVEGALSLFGWGPGSLVRWIPQGWAIVFRGCGEWTFRLEGETRAVVRISGLPRMCLASDGWPVAVMSSLQALIELTDSVGDVERRPVDVSADALEFVMTWVVK